MSEKREVKWTEVLKTAVNEPGTISEAYSQFHSYSVGNRVLMMVQCMMSGIKPGPVAGYRQWQDKDRQVRKGEKALGIWIPISYKVKVEDEETGEDVEEKRLSFKWRNCMFTVWQTEGDEIQFPEVENFDRQKILERFGLSERDFDALDGNTQGFANWDNEISINPLGQHQFRTWVHEVAHQALGHTNGRQSIPHNQKELEAEGIALIVGEVLGLDGAEESRGYIQNWWGEGREIPEHVARQIFSTAEEILKAGRDE